MTYRNEQAGARNHLHSRRTGHLATVAILLTVMGIFAGTGCGQIDLEEEYEAPEIRAANRPWTPLRGTLGVRICTCVLLRVQSRALFDARTFPPRRTTTKPSVRASSPRADALRPDRGHRDGPPTNNTTRSMRTGIGIRVPRNPARASMGSPASTSGNPQPRPKTTRTSRVIQVKRGISSL